MDKIGQYGQNWTLQSACKSWTTYKKMDKIVKSWKIWTNRQKPENTYVEARDDARVKKSKRK